MHSEQYNCNLVQAFPFFLHHTLFLYVNTNRTETVTNLYPLHIPCNSLCTLLDLCTYTLEVNPTLFSYHD